ncbi:MAG TPA: GrpB family protein [Clostridia bacterium]|nr:GrpB family protein [Clostridia bacterium]
MRQDFSNVTPEALAALFPVLLAGHDPQWREDYLKEEKYLRSVFGKELERIGHIGSTAVPGLTAKPTIDILLEVAQGTDLMPFTELLLDAGYVVNHPPADLIMYLKGYTPEGFRGQAFHIHVRYRGDWDEPYFRDYLIAHPEAAAEYAELKRALKERFPFDRDGYTAEKGAFVKRCTSLARAKFPGKYGVAKR